MNINTKRVLDGKKSPIQKQFEILRDNYTLENSIRYLDFVRHQSSDVILENAQYIYSEPRSGADFIMAVLRTNDLSAAQLRVQKEGLDKYISKCRTNGYNNPVHLDRLNECAEFINAELSKKDNLKYVRENLIYNMHINFLPKSTLMESTITNSLDKVIQNINHQPEVINEYERLVDEIKAWKAGTAAINFVPTLVKNTALVLGITVVLTGVAVTLIVSLPLLLVSKLLSDGINKKYIKSYNAAIDREIKRVEEGIASAPSDKKGMLEEYLKSLKEAKAQLDGYKPSKKTTKAVKEGNLGQELEEMGEVDCCEDDIDEEDPEVDELALNFSIEFLEAFLDDFEDDSEMTEAQMENFNNMIRIAYQYDRVVTEGIVGKIARKAALKGEEISRKTVHGIKKAGDDAKHVTTVAKKIPEHVDNLVNSTIDSIKKVDKDERRRRIIEGKYRYKLFKIIRNAIGLGAAFAVHPALAAIGFLVSVAMDKKADDKVRKEILHELENELVIVSEKIEDAKGDQKRKEKYELMRIKNRLEDDITRIKYRLD